MKLLRPYIPVSVRVMVASRQLRGFGVSIVPDTGESKIRYLARLLTELSTILAIRDGRPNDESLHLDHNPALENRDKVFRAGKHIGYVPEANDPEHLIYRTQHAHQIKTNVRGDGAQYSDRALAARERRRNRKKKSQPIRSANRWPPRGSRKIARRAK